MAQKNSAPSSGTKKKYHIEMTSLSLFFWGFCLCFLVTWVFVLGVLVGRGFLPSAVSTISELKDQIARLQGLVIHSKSSQQAVPKTPDPDPKLAFYEKLSNKKEDVKKKVPPEDRPIVPKGEASQARPETQQKGGEVRKTDDPGVAKKTLETVPPTPAGTLPFTVQLASLEERAKAENMTRLLRERGFDAFFYEVKVKGKTFYRVRSGKFRTREEAALQAKKLTDQAGMNGFVTKID